MILKKYNSIQMPKLIKEPKVINSVGTKPKIIKEFFGRVSGNHW